MVDSSSIERLNNPAVYGTLPHECPVFTKDDDDGLALHLTKQVGSGRGAQVASRLDPKRIKPSTKLLEVVDQAIQDRFEWRLLDDQLLIFNTVVSRVEEAGMKSRKHAVVVQEDQDQEKVFWRYSYLPMLQDRAGNYRMEPDPRPSGRLWLH